MVPLHYGSVESAPRPNPERPESRGQADVSRTVLPRYAPSKRGCQGLSLTREFRTIPWRITQHERLLGELSGDFLHGQ
jgi:hypothetical protein